jgi:3-dehydroquinate synthase
MTTQQIVFKDGQQVNYYLGASFTYLSSLHPKNQTVILVDEVVFNLHQSKFEGYSTIKVKSSEANKSQATVDKIIEQMLTFNVDKSWMLIGVGGGVITDMAGYTASIYKRGIKLGLVPTTILGMTDAAIGGKNGVNVGELKNMVGTMYRSTFILFDYDFLNTLPKLEWINGFAEIIKHACIKDPQMFNELDKFDMNHYLNDKNAIAQLIEKNIDIKTAVVLNDEHETAERYILNFGHTFGHAIENTNQLPHGFAVSIGMIIAAKISEEINNFYSTDKVKLINLLEKYGLPTSLQIDLKQSFEILKKDKKAQGDSINFVLLNKIGEASVQKIPFSMLASMVDQIL